MMKTSANLWATGVFFVAAYLVTGCGGSGSTYNAAAGTGGSTGAPGTTGSTGVASLISDLGINVNPKAIDDSGRILVANFSGTGTTYFFLKDGVRTEVPPLPDGGTATPEDMNFKGTVLVSSYAGNSFKNSYLLQNGIYTLLTQPSPAGPSRLMASSRGVALAENDWVVGTNGTYWTSPSTTLFYPSPAKFVPLAINSSGTIIGVTQSLFPFAQLSDEYYKISNGVATNMGFKSGYNFISGYDAAAINDAGTIAISSDQQTRIFPGGGGAMQLAPFEISSRITSDGRFSGNSAAVQIDPGLNLLDGAAAYASSIGVSGKIKDKFSPGTLAKMNYANGINNVGQLVGSYLPGGKGTPSHGYLVVIGPDFFTAATVKVTVTGGATTLEGGGVAQFAAQVANTANQAVSWVVDEPGGGTISSGGLYTAPLKAGKYHVRATSAADIRVSAAAETVIVSIGGEAGPSRSGPVLVNGPAEGFVISQVTFPGEMVGYSKNATSPEALYWYAADSPWQVLNRTGYSGAKATGVTGGVIVGYGLDSQGFAFPVCWPTPNSSPVPLKVPSNSSFIQSNPSISLAQKIVCGNLYWTNYQATATVFPLWPSAVTTQRSMILGDGSIVVLGSPGYRYADQNSSPVALGTGSFAGTFAASYTGDDLVGWSGAFAPPVPTVWSRASNFAGAPISPFSLVDLATPSFAEPSFIAATVKYQDGTPGIGLWQTNTPYLDLRALIPQGTGWELTNFIGDANGTYVVTGKKSGGSETYLYIR